MPPLSVASGKLPPPSAATDRMKVFFVGDNRTTVIGVAAPVSHWGSYYPAHLISPAASPATSSICLKRRPAMSALSCRQNTTGSFAICCLEPGGGRLAGTSDWNGFLAPRILLQREVLSLSSRPEFLQYVQVVHSFNGVCTAESIGWLHP